MRPVLNPYVGPQALNEGASLYGRSMEVGDVVDLLVSSRIVLLYSPSGAGKTSLIQAGLLTALRDELRFSVTYIKGFGGSASGKNRYLTNLYDVLDGPNASHGHASVELGLNTVHLDKYLRQRRLPPHELPRRTTERDALTYRDVRNIGDGDDSEDESAQQPQGHILIFDQFEEIFTLDTLDRDAKAQFFREVGHALKDRTRCALFSMREDHIAELDDYLHLLPTQLKARYRLGLLDREHARAAIEGPALERGVRFEPAAAERLVNELCKVRRQSRGGTTEFHISNFVEPVQLQVVCHRLWERLYGGVPPNNASSYLSQERTLYQAAPANTITPDEVSEVSVDSALEQFYNDKVRAAARATHVSESDIRPWFERELITAHGIRGQVLCEPERSGGLPNATIHHLENAHLVRMEARGDRRWYELAHDRLVAPIQASNEAWKATLAPLQRRTVEWEALDRRSDVFLSPIAWASAFIWSRVRQASLRPSERDFLRHSLQAILSNHLLVGLLVMAIGIFIFALYLAGVSIRQLDLRNQQLADSEARLRISSAAYKAQVTASQRTMNHALVSTATLARSYQELSSATLRDELAFTVRETMYSTLRNAADIRRIFVGDNTVLRAVAFHPSPSEPLFVYAGDAGSITFAGIDSGPIGTLVNVCADATGQRRGVNSLAFSNDGTRLVAGCDNGTVAMWHTASTSVHDWSETARWHPHKVTRAVAFNRDGTLIASGGDHNEVKLMHIAPDGSAASTPPDSVVLMPPRPMPVTTILSVAFSPTDNKLVAGDSKMYVWLCDLDAGPACESTDVRQAPDANDRTHAIAFAADGRSIVTGHASGRLVLWDVTTKIANPRSIGTARPSPIYGVALYDRKEGKDDTSIPYIAYGADGLRQQPLALAQRPRSSQQRPSIGPDEVYDIALHAPSGLVVAVTRSGYVAVIETRVPPDHLASKYPLAADSTEGCAPRVHDADAARHDGVPVRHGMAEPWIVVACDSLVLLGLVTDWPNTITVLQTVPAAGVAQGRIRQVATSSDRRRVATLGADHTVKFWRYESELVEDKSMAPLDVAFFRDTGFEAEQIERIVLSPNGEFLLATFAQRDKFLLLDLRAPPPRRGQAIPTRFREIRALAFDEKMSSLAIAGAVSDRPASDPDHITVSNFSEGRVTEERFSVALNAQAEQVGDILIMHFDQDHDVLVVGAGQGQLHAWDARDGKEIYHFPGDSPDAIEKLTAATNQQLLASVDSRGKTTLWDARTWSRLMLSNRLERAPDTDLLGFNADGSKLLSANNDLTVWNLNVPSLHKEVCAILGRGGGDGSAGTPREVIHACAAAGHR